MNELQQSWGDWIIDLADWEWFATFTFRYPTSPRTANHIWRKHWLRELEKTVNGQVHFVRVLEDDDDNLHYHCLLSGVGEQNPNTWINRWEWGICEIKAFNKELGGAYYLGKKCPTENIAFSKHIERVGIPNQVGHLALLLGQVF